MTANIRFALRRLQRNPGFTATILLTLGLCIGANLIIFAVVDAILIRPLPFPGSDRLIVTIHSYPGAGVDRIGCSIPNYYDWRKSIPAFSSTAAIKSGSVVIGEGGTPSRMARERVTPEFFATLGVQPALGRFFTEEETDYGRSQVTVLTDEYWRNHFDADPKAVGRTLRIDGQITTVVGILPRGFRYLSSRAQIFSPLASNADERTPQNRHSDNVQVIARLAPGATLATAQAQINAFDIQQLKDDPYADQLKAANAHTWVYSLHADHVRNVRPTLLLLQGGALTLLLIGGGNLMNLLLIRASSRAKEFAVRQALGASRRHVVREVLVETILLACGGGLLGLAAGAFGIDLLSVLRVAELPFGAEITFSGRVAAVAMLGSLAVGAALSAPIIWLNLHGQLNSALQTETRGGTSSRAAQRLRHAFIVAQIALAFILLTGAGLLGMSLQRVLAVSPGFQPEHILTGQLGLTAAKYREENSRLAFNERLISELRGQPGVSYAAIATTPPFSGEAEKTIITVEGYVAPPGDSIRGHYICASAGDVWQVLGIPLREGRLLEDADNHRKPGVCLVDEAFAHRYWPKGGAIGHRVVKDATFREDEALTIVGIVGQVKQSELTDTSDLGTVYRPYQFDTAENFYVILRSSLPPAALATTLQKTVQRLDPELPVHDIRTMQERIDASLVQRRSPALLAVFFASVSLLLVIVGTYGVIAFNVLQRRHEVGIRIALGAQRADVLGLVLRQGVKLAALGIILGLAGSFAMTHAVRSLLFGISPSDPLTLVGVSAVLAGVAVLACWIPARRAAQVNPLVALRGD